MIKSLFDETDEKIQDEIEEINQSETQIKHPPVPDEKDSFEVFSANVTQGNDLTEMRPVENFEDKQTAEILQDVDNNVPNAVFTSSNPFEPTTTEMPLKEKEIDEPMLFQMQNKPESTAETARKSGLAMSAAIALFGSVVFLLVIGWIADLLLGTSPWGIVGGIVLGSIVGFFQFFRMTSQILKNKD